MNISSLKYRWNKFVRKNIISHPLRKRLIIRGGRYFRITVQVDLSITTLA